MQTDKWYSKTFSFMHAKTANSTNPYQLVHMSLSADQSQYYKNEKGSAPTDQSIMHLDATIKLDKAYPARHKLPRSLEQTWYLMQNGS